MAGTRLLGQGLVRKVVQVVQIGGVQYAAITVRGSRYLVRSGATSRTYELRSSGRAVGEWVAVAITAPHECLAGRFAVCDDEEGGEVVVVTS